MNSARRAWLVMGVAGLLWAHVSLAQTFIVTGSVTDGTDGVAGATVTALGETISEAFSTTTDITGSYTLNLGQGTYGVSASRLGMDFLPAACLLQLNCSTNATVSVGPGIPNPSGVDFSVVYSVSGRVFDGVTGLRGVLVSVQAPFRQAALTDLTGTYQINGLQRGQYVLLPTFDGYTFDPSSRLVDVPATTNIDFAGYALFSISGTVRSGGAGFAGVNVALQGSGISLSSKTDAAGSFVFSDLEHGTYTVTPSLQGYSFSPASITALGATNLSFVVATLSLSGRVTDGVNGILGVQIQALTGTNLVTTQTDATGRYAFGDLAGTYAITPVANGQTFNPARRTLSVGAGTNSIDFQQALTATDTLITTCDEPSLNLALSFGGTIGFDCDGSDATVVVDQTITVRTNAILDGGAVGATISGNGGSLFAVVPGIGFNIRNLTLTGGLAAGMDGTNGTAGGAAFGGAVYNGRGVLTVLNSTFSGNQASGGAGGAGLSTLDGSSLDGGGGGAAYGGAIYNDGGTLLLTNCVFSGNAATGGSGGAGADAPASGGSTDGGGGGGGGSAGGSALYNSALGTVVAVDCTFSANVTTGAAGGVGGVGNGGLGFPGANGTPGSANGGGILNDGGTIVISFATFASNSVVGANGFDGQAGGFSSPGDNGSAGSAAGGGAILNRGGRVSATNCTLYANSVAGGNGGSGGSGGTVGFGGKGGSGGNGGDGNGGGIFNQGGETALVNVTFSKNVASGGAAGAAGAAGAGTAQPGKPGTAGGSNGGAIANTGGSLTEVNTILAYGTPGKNAFGVIGDGGNNLSSDATPIFTTTSSRNSIDPLLSNLADNGGPTQTAALSASSPAINTGNPALAPAVDQRHLARSGTGDIGAFEYNAQLPVARLSVSRARSDVLISWPAAAPGYRLQVSPSLSPVSWQDATNTPAIVDFNYVVTVAVGSSSDFYRLVQ